MKYPLFWAGLVSCLIVSLVTTVRGEPRTWTATDGREIEAEYISSTDTSVKVRITSSRQEYDIPLDRLSQQDRDWIAEANKPKPIDTIKVVNVLWSKLFKSRSRANIYSTVDGIDRAIASSFLPATNPEVCRPVYNVIIPSLIGPK